MQNPDNLNAAANRHVNNQVLTDWKALQAGMEFIPISTHIREPSKFPACFLNFVKELIRIVWIVLGYSDHAWFRYRPARGLADTTNPFVPVPR
jgi:hypothetical protein